MKERLYYILMNILEKLEQSVNVERITNNEIDTLFGSASGTGTDAQDYVVEHYNSATEGYTKWASGKCEVWKRFNKSLSATVAWSGGVYYGAYTDNSITYTMTGFTGFIEPPSAQITIRSTNGNFFGLTGQYNEGSTTSYGSYYVYSVGSQSNVPSTIQLYAVGRWK